MLGIGTTLSCIERSFLIGVHSLIQILSDAEHNGVCFSWHAAVWFGLEQRIKWSARFRSRAKLGFCISATKLHHGLAKSCSHLLTPCGEHLWFAGKVVDHAVRNSQPMRACFSWFWLLQMMCTGRAEPLEHAQTFQLQRKQKRHKAKLSGADGRFMPSFAVVTLGTHATCSFVRLGLKCTAAAWPESKLGELHNCITFHEACFWNTPSYYL